MNERRKQKKKIYYPVEWRIQQATLTSINNTIIGNLEYTSSDKKELLRSMSLKATFVLPGKLSKTFQLTNF